jgi:hypothetical protein
VTRYSLGGHPRARLIATPLGAVRRLPECDTRPTPRRIRGHCRLRRRDVQSCAQRCNVFRRSAFPKCLPIPLRQLVLQSLPREPRVQPAAEEVLRPTRFSKVPDPSGVARTKPRGKWGQLQLASATVRSSGGAHDRARRERVNRRSFGEVGDGSYLNPVNRCCEHTTGNGNCSDGASPGIAASGFLCWTDRA